MPSCAVTTTGIVFAPTPSGTAADAVPEATATPDTVAVAFASRTVGVTANDDVAFPTDRAYAVAPALNDGESVPLDTARDDRELSVDGAAMTMVIRIVEAAGAIPLDAATVNPKEPAVVGVPLSTPAGVSARPLGIDPVATVNTGDGLPDAVNVYE